MKKTLDLLEKIVRQLDPQKRENLAGDIVAVKQKLMTTNDELQMLAKGIGDAALKAGIYNGQVDLMAPQLMQLLDDMATSLAPKAQMEQPRG